MNRQKLIALYTLLDKLIEISDPDSAEIEAIACTRQQVKDLLLDEYDMFIS